MNLYVIATYVSDMFICTDLQHLGIYVSINLSSLLVKCYSELVGLESLCMSCCHLIQKDRKTLHYIIIPFFHAILTLVATIAFPKNSANFSFFLLLPYLKNRKIS